MAALLPGEFALAREAGNAFLFGERSSLVYKLLFCVFVFLGSVVSAFNVMDFGDTMILSMALPNTVGLYLLAPRVRGALDRYEAKLAAGEFKVYR